jgi:hypothetical protein
MSKKNLFQDYLATKAAEKHVFECDNDKKDIQNDEVAIIVLDRGWAFVGVITMLENGRIRADNCYNIHRWGTTRGLGQLAVNGPREETILNPAGTIYGEPIFLMKTDPALWIYEDKD